MFDSEFGEAYQDQLTATFSSTFNFPAWNRAAVLPPPPPDQDKLTDETQTGFPPT